MAKPSDRCHCTVAASLWKCYFGWPACLPTQSSVLNAAAWSIAGLRHCDNITNAVASFCWLRAPEHIEFKLVVVVCQLARELTPCISKFCLDEWQDMWDCCEGNKLYSVYLAVGIVEHSKNVSCCNSVLINIGHCRLTHSHLLCYDSPSTCESCGLPLTMKDISGMWQFAGHSCKIFYSLFCEGVVCKR